MFAQVLEPSAPPVASNASRSHVKENIREEHTVGNNVECGERLRTLLPGQFGLPVTK
jgi:hypothetical protein